MTLFGESERRGPQGRRVKTSDGEIKTLIRMIVYAVARGERVAHTLSHYLRLVKGRLAQVNHV